MNINQNKLANDVADQLNNMSFSKEEFCDNMCMMHRYLQEEFTYLCIEWLRKCGSDSYEYDGRNEHSHEFGKKLIDMKLI